MKYIFTIVFIFCIFSLKSQMETTDSKDDKTYKNNHFGIRTTPATIIK